MVFCEKRANDSNWPNNISHVYIYGIYIWYMYDGITIATNMRKFLLCIFLIALYIAPSSTLIQKVKRILLIGDSLDRLIVFDYCNFRGGHFSQWGDHTIKYGGQRGTKMPSAICEENIKSIHDPNISYNNTIAFFHIFNSAAKGPYLWIDTRDPYADSAPRIDKAVELYRHQIGEPTEILFQSELWDARPYIVHEQLNESTNPRWKETLSEFRSNVLERIQQIRVLFPNPNITIGLRTCPWTHYGGDLTWLTFLLYEIVLFTHNFVLIIVGIITKL